MQFICRLVAAPLVMLPFAPEQNSSRGDAGKPMTSAEVRAREFFAKNRKDVSDNSYALYSPHADDEVLDHLGALSQLETLHIFGGSLFESVSRKDPFDFLAGLTALRTLTISERKLTNAHLVHLQGLQKLEVLSLAEGNITDAGLRSLKGLRQLKSLTLVTTRATGRALGDLTELERLQSINLLGSEITDDVMRHLPRFLRLLDAAP